MANMRKLIALTVVAALAIVAAGYFLLVSPKNAEAADLDAQAAKEASSQGALRQQIAMLSQDEKHAATYQAQLDTLKVHMPDQLDEPAFIREVVKAAGLANVVLSDITPGTPTTPTAQLLAPKPVPTATDTATDAASTSASASPATAPVPAAVDPSLGLSVIPVGLHVSGTYSNVADFLRRLNKLNRAFLVQNVSLAIAQPPAAPAAAPGSAPAAAAAPAYSGRLDATISGSIFSAGSPGVIGVVDTPTVTPTPTASAATPKPTTSPTGSK
jgi:type IV pilus assembly protein PilO